MDTTTTFNWIELIKLLTPIITPIITPLLIALGLFLTSKQRMKKKINKKLTKSANKGEFLLPENKLMDMLYRDHFAQKPVLVKRFFNLFIESMRELIESESIIRINKAELFCPYPHPMFKGDIDPFPPHESRIPKTPSDYSLQECDPDTYIGLNTTECEKYMKPYKDGAAYKLKIISEHY